MKRGFTLLLFLIVILCACGKSPSSAPVGFSSSPSVEDVLNQNTTGSGEHITVTVPVKEDHPESHVRSAEVDVDLTAMSATMVYAEVFNMVNNPDAYVGKTVRMEGMFSPYHDDKTDTDKFACVIMDATACCAQGIEFYLKTPADAYPEQWGNVMVIGTFEYEDMGVWRYCKLVDAEMEY